MDRSAQPHFSAQQPFKVRVGSNCSVITDFPDLKIQLPKCHIRKARAIVAMSTSQSSALQHVLATFKTKVDPKLASEFEMTTLPDLKHALASIQRKHASERRIRNMGRLSRFLDAMDQYGKVIEVFLNVTDVLAFVWGPMKFLLQVTNTFSEAFSKLLETYQLIGESLPLLDKCQGFLENTPYVRQALESIFHDILEFHEYALGYFRKPSDKETKRCRIIELYKLGWVTWMWRQIMKVSHESDTTIKKQALGFSAILCFSHGKMGPCREKASNVTIWFYCRHGDNGRNTFVALARALISQLLKYDMDLVPYVHEKMSTRSEQMLISEPLAKDLLETLLKNCQGLYIILDGLDECARGEEKKILEWFRSVMERDAITTRFLRDLPTIAITSSNSLHDITTFVSSWGRKIQEKFNISVDDEKTMNEMVVERAAGMFLFAKLVMTALYSQISREKLYNEVNVKGIPKGLEAAYSRVLDAILEQTSRSEALQLLAWLVCAKRPLEWREILAAVAIDIDGETVDFYGRQWMVNAKDLCGSLVETRSDGSLELVHTTAKFYLIDNGVINVCHEELKIACLCLGYLALPGFERVLAESSVEDLLKIGYYAFVDYAACYWTSHLRAGLARGVPEQYTGTQIGHLERFIDSHYRPCSEDIQIPVATRSMLSCLQEPEICSFNRFEDFLKAFVATERQVKNYGEGAASNIALDIPDIIARIRAVLEDTARRESWDETDRRLFTFFYGEVIYKCPRISCSYFHHGFTSSKEREAHIRKHTLPYSCSYPGCLRVALGFPSPSDLQRHISQVHEMAQTKTRTFPLKQKRLVLQCGICQQGFSKPGQLRTHDCRNDDALPRPLEDAMAQLPPNQIQQTSDDLSILDASRNPHPGLSQYSSIQTTDAQPQQSTDAQPQKSTGFTLDFSALEDPDILENFDFDTFLKMDSDNAGFGFSPTLAAQSADTP
ncbi:hypothetical protein HFD88_001600 [Aspergillus terreus]|nr:hypothetical protein HFD88_001600 [Aspergillus terreus]